MEKIKLQVSGSQIQVVERPAAITAGTVGLEAEFVFDSHWDNLGKTVVFRAGDKVITAALEGDTHIVPWEVLEKADLWLIVGIYGANAEGTVVIPTLWTKVAAIYTGVEPEGDPTLEPANPVWQETLARVAAMEPQVQEHISNTDNPHGVTCEQLGAVTQKEFRDVVSNLDGSNNPGELIPHLLNRDNPHGVTAAQAGAAPAGYGLGETSSRSANNWGGDLNSFQRGNTGSPDGGWWHGFVCKEYGNITTNLAFKPNNGVWLSAMRGRTSDGAWREWEYINPPMELDVEYRTIERVNGTPLYTVLVSCGASVDGMTVDISQFGIINVVRYNAFVAGTALPRINSRDFSNPWSMYVNVSKDAITIYSGSEMAGRQLYCQIWYTKA